MKNKILLFTLFLLFAGFQPVVQALALGELELKSHLNQQLDVRIPIIFSKAGELDSLKASISRPEDKNQGLQSWHNLKVEIVADEGSQPYLQISSGKTVREPALNFIVDLTWPNGRILREYSLLIDIQ